MKINMKQTLEEAAKEAAEDCYEMPYDEKLINMKLIKEAFKYGAEWQSKQSPWISVKDRLPELGDPVLIRLKDGTVRLAVLDTDDNSDAYFWSDNYSYETISGWDTTHWMPIPPLESNGNELKRKEK